MSSDWDAQAYQTLLSEDYSKVASFYEQAIEAQPQMVSNYWYLGLSYLLLGNEANAQAVWMTPMLEGSEAEVEQWTAELSQILETEALRQESLSNLQKSWLIRGHLREVAPSDLNNLLHFLCLSIKTESFSLSKLREWKVTETIKNTSAEYINTNLLLETLRQVLDYLVGLPEIEPEILWFCEVCLSCVSDPKKVLEILKGATARAYYLEHHSALAIDLAKLCLKACSEDLDTLKNLYYFHVKTGAFEAAIDYAKRYFSHCQSLSQKAFGNYMVLQGLLITGGRWSEAIVAIEYQKTLLGELIQTQEKTGNAFSLIASPLLLNYVQDDLADNRWFQNQVAQFCQQNLSPDNLPISQNSGRVIAPAAVASKRLKIGYISHCLRQHSVGWLSRWLFQHHNRDEFHLSLYLFLQPVEEFTRRWFIDKVDTAIRFENPDAVKAAQKIADDEIDILIDLESVTHTDICNVMALKPAPIQATWLGADASGLSAIDYFIVDPYVLPDNAQDYYQEKLWRLPQTYVAIDGFEVGIPTLRRDRLGIAQDAVIYMSVQTGHKRNPHLSRLQLKILKQVPHSYLLIKGYSDNVAVQKFFLELATEEGLNPDRLRFLPPDPTEEIHRANLRIADVVLDTYPYNGATTTLEVLWMGVPLVTRVGQQFSARNSYAFMSNAGLTEGIAWTDEQYIEWGTRLGQDKSLRQQVAWKLGVARQTSPLWNAQQFTREMEKAYQQMWLNYLENQSA